MRQTLKQTLPFGIVIAMTIMIIAYALYQSRAIIQGPKITLESPADGITSTTSLIHVIGSVKHAKEITLQGNPIFIDLQGYFSQQLLLMDGYNIIELRATDAQGHTEEKSVEIVYQPESRNITP